MSGHLLKSNDLDVAKSKNIHMIIGYYAVIGCGHAVGCRYRAQLYLYLEQLLPHEKIAGEKRYNT